MLQLVGLQPITGDYVHWQFMHLDPLAERPELVEEGSTEEEWVDILFNLRPVDDPAKALHWIVQYNEITWLSPTNDSDEWMIDLDEMSG